jgi:hypothetical protein
MREVVTAQRRCGRGHNRHRWPLPFNFFIHYFLTVFIAGYAAVALCDPYTYTKELTNEKLTQDRDL